MRGRLWGTAVVAVTVLAALVVTSAGQGSVAARGGNHGCDLASGTLRSDDFWKGGDRVVGGFYTQEPMGFPSEEHDILVAENRGPAGEPNGLSCSGEVGAWRKFISDLGPGDDRVRLDAVGLQNKYSGGVPGELPAQIESLLLGGSGADRMRGHRGPDAMRGGPGNDVLTPGKGRDSATGGGGNDLFRAKDGRKDQIRCGRGRLDKAIVDRRDDASGCERLVVR